MRFMTFDRSITSLLFLLTLFIASCEPEFDKPPVDGIEKGDVLTIQDLRDMYNGNPIRFEENKSVYGVITMDGRNGNIYKSAYMKDHTGAINLSLAYSGGLYEGDSIRINLKGCVLTDYNGLVQIDSVDVDTNIVKQATNVEPQPQVLSSLGQLDSSYQSKLVKLKGVEFHPSHRQVNFADGTNQQSLNRTVLDCQGNSVIMRTSGYADFADQKTASGNGSMIAIVSQFQETLQLLIRRPEELKMNDQICVVKANNFNGGSIAPNGWTVQDVTGPQTWSTNDQGASSTYAEISGYDGMSNNANEDWLISPSFDASNGSHLLKFRNAKNYSGPDMEVLISTDYSGSGNPNNATWTNLSYNKSGGSWNWVQGGPVDLSSYNATQTYIAFKYTSTSTDGATWEVDDISIKKQ
ncbi:MAG: DUF5689 domain-containing protein [Flavobacteriales bacterium]